MGVLCSTVLVNHCRFSYKSWDLTVHSPLVGERGYRRSEILLLETCLAQILYCLQRGFAFAPCSELQEGPGMQGSCPGCIHLLLTVSWKESFRAGLCVDGALSPSSLRVIGGGLGISEGESPAVLGSAESRKRPEFFQTEDCTTLLGGILT